MHSGSCSNKHRLTSLSIWSIVQLSRDWEMRENLHHAKFPFVIRFDVLYILD